MARGLNKVMLIGHIGQEPQLRYFPDGDAILNLSIATHEQWKNKKGETVERTEWHKIVLYRKLAEIAAQYVKKGSKLYIEGKLCTRKWKDLETKDAHTITEIDVDEFQLLDQKPETFENSKNEEENPAAD